MDIKTIHIQLTFLTSRFEAKHASPEMVSVAFIKRFMEDLSAFARVFPPWFPVEAEKPLGETPTEALETNNQAVDNADLMVAFYANGERDIDRDYSVIRRISRRKPLLIFSNTHVYGNSVFLRGAIEGSGKTTIIRKDVTAYKNHIDAKQAATAVRETLEELEARKNAGPKFTVLSPAAERIRDTVLAG